MDSARLRSSRSPRRWGLAMTVAPQMSPSSDSSSRTGQSVSDGWVTTKVKSELATTKGE